MDIILFLITVLLLCLLYRWKLRRPDNFPPGNLQFVFKQMDVISNETSTNASDFA